MILAQTIKGYGLGEAGEGRNITHQQKKLNEQEIAQFRSRFEIPIPDEAARERVVLPAADDSPEMAYLHERRRQLGGYMPARTVPASRYRSAAARVFEGIAGRLERAAKFRARWRFVRVLTLLMKHPQIGKRVVPIIPGRSAHVRHGVAVPAVRDLRQPGAAL